jgi:hypothetical protein
MPKPATPVVLLRGKAGLALSSRQISSTDFFFGGAAMAVAATAVLYYVSLIH